MRTISYSQMSLFWQCPRKWYNQYIEEYKRPKIQVFIFGGAVHEYIESKLLNTSFESDIEGVDELGDKAIESLTKFKELGYSNLHQKVELDFDLPMENGAFRGYIDLCFINKYGEHIIIDWKTTSKEFTVHDIVTSNQLTCYAYAYWRMFDIIPAVYYITLNKKSLETKLYHAKRDIDDMREIEKQIIDTIYSMDRLTNCKNDKSCIGEYGKCQFYKQCWNDDVTIVDGSVELWTL